MRTKTSNVNQYLREKRLEAGFTQSDLARVLGYKSQFVANWERGVSNPPSHVLRKIITVLRIPEDEILQLLYEESMRYWQEIICSGTKRKSFR